MPASERMRLWRVLLALGLFGIAFGFVEASVVVYLRAILEPYLAQIEPGRGPNDLFPLIPLETLLAEQPGLARLLTTELAREAATLLMLAGAGFAAGRNVREGFAGSAIAFGVWDVFYYVFLWVLIGWPQSLLTWDLLFLLPVAWVGPVIAPCIVSALLIACGALVLWRDAAGNPVEAGLGHWGGLILGAVVVMVAFAWEFPQIHAGALPQRFPWGVFALGNGIALAAFLHACGRLPFASRYSSR